MILLLKILLNKVPVFLVTSSLRLKYRCENCIIVPYQPYRPAFYSDYYDIIGFILP